VWLLQKAEIEKTKPKKVNPDKSNDKKTMKDKVLEKEFKLVSGLASASVDRISHPSCLYGC
jgi:hypothetical protein